MEQHSSKMAVSSLRGITTVSESTIIQHNYITQRNAHYSNATDYMSKGDNTIQPRPLVSSITSIPATATTSQQTLHHVPTNGTPYTATCGTGIEHRPPATATTPTTTSGATIATRKRRHRQQQQRQRRQHATFRLPQTVQQSRAPKNLAKILSRESPHDRKKRLSLLPGHNGNNIAVNT
jgi:hypothetical protein